MFRKKSLCAVYTLALVLGSSLDRAKEDVSAVSSHTAEHQLVIASFRTFRHKSGVDLLI